MKVNLNIFEKTKVRSQPATSGSFVIIPSYIVFGATICWFLLPYVALQFSDTLLISSLYSSFVMLMLLACALPVLVKLRVLKTAFFMMIALVILLVLGVYKGVSYGISLSDAAKSAYEALGALILFTLILASKITVKNLHSSLMRPLLIIAFINAIYMMYQYFFLHSHTELWFYAPLTNMGHELNEWNMIRDGVVRAVGMFTSPLESIYLTSLAFFYFTVKAVKVNSIYAFFSIFYLIVGYMAGVRIFFVGIIIALLALFLIGRARQRPVLLFIILPLSVIVVTYIGLIFSSSKLDLSALDRLLQIQDLFILLVENPFGYGFGSVGMGKEFVFDSVYATWFLSLGIVGGFLIIYAYYLISKRLLQGLPLVASNDEYLLLLTIIIFSVVFIFISQFQYAIITPVRWFYVMAAAIILNRVLMRETQRTFYVKNY